MVYKMFKFNSNIMLVIAFGHVLLKSHAYTLDVSTFKSTLYHVTSFDTSYNIDVIFTTSAWSRVHCGNQCSQHVTCMTFTYSDLSGICQGHSANNLNYGNLISSPGTTILQKGKKNGYLWNLTPKPKP